MGVKRSFSSKINKLYGGSTWWSLSRETLQYVINYTKKEKYLINRMKYTFCPEELYFQTVIMNSDYSKKVINNNLRYMDWNYRRVGKYSSSPAVLNLSDLIHIKRSFYLFARKFESSISNDLKSALLK